MSGWLKPADCARCGKPPIREKDTYWSLWRVRCPKCNRATGFMFTANEATVAWNVRNTTPTPNPPRMTDRRAAAILREFNLYRRGNGHYEWTVEPGHDLNLFHSKYSVRELGYAIDHAVKVLSKPKKEGKQ